MEDRSSVVDTSSQVGDVLNSVYLKRKAAQTWRTQNLPRGKKITWYLAAMCTE